MTRKGTIRARIWDALDGLGLVAMFVALIYAPSVLGLI